MEICLSLSAKSIGVLYHATTKEKAVSILRSGNMILATGRAVGAEEKIQSDSIYFASFTRSRTGQYHYGTDGSKTNTVILTVDGTALSARYKLRPVDYWNNSAAIRRSEAEERLVSDKRAVPILKYIKRIDVVMPAVANSRHALSPSEVKASRTGLSTLAYFAKKLGVPIGFYNSALDWSLKRNEFSPVAKLPAPSREKYVDSYDYKHLATLLSALKLPTAELIKYENREALEACRYPDSAYTTFTNNTRAASGPMQTVMDRILRMFKRLGIKTAADLRRVLSEKYSAAEKIKTEVKARADADAVAGSLVRLLTLTQDKLEEKDLLFLSTDPRFTGVIDTRISYYLSRYVEDFGHSPTTAKAYALLGVTGKSLDVYDVLDQVRRRFR